MPSTLIVKLGAIGDCAMLLPAVLARVEAGWEVTWVCGRTVEPLLRLYPALRLIVVEEKALLRGSLPERLRALLALARKLRFANYDIVATLYYDRRYRLLTAATRARSRITLSHTDRRFRLLPGRHHTDEYDRILSGRDDGERSMSLAPARAAVPACSMPPLADRARFVLVPAGARNLLNDDALRRWPIAHYVQLASLLLARGHEVVLAGGDGDRWASPHFDGLAVTDAIGRYSLVESLSLFESAAVTITHDTGPLHLAGLTATAIVALFGPVEPASRLPRRTGCVALWGGAGFACRPCYDGQSFAACTHNGCLDELPPERVLQEAERLLEATARQQPARVIDGTGAAAAGRAAGASPLIALHPAIGVRV